MLRWCARQYQRRIVNINVNIVVSGFAAAILTTAILKILKSLGALEDAPKYATIAITLGLDMFFDIIIAVGLHWLANHWPRKWQTSRSLVDKADRVIDAAPPPISFLKDATQIQFQRIILSPIFYLTAAGMQWLLLHEGVPKEWTALPSLITGVLLTRVFHTPWLLYSERQVWKQWEEATQRRMQNNEPIMPSLRELAASKRVNAAAFEPVAPKTPAEKPSE